MEEDPSRNRLEDSLELFEHVTSSLSFKDKDWIVLFNKEDLVTDEVWKDEALTSLEDGESWLLQDQAKVCAPYLSSSENLELLRTWRSEGVS
jgi:hypothetical protein